jgi:hypothetical protein
MFCADVDANAEQIRRGMPWVFVRYAPRDLLSSYCKGRLALRVYQVGERACQTVTGGACIADALPAPAKLFQAKSLGAFH